MEFSRLGHSGLMVSRICLGCMSYGDTSKGWHGDWLLDEDAARPFFRKALEGGINFFDTANVYAGGTSEEITGKLLREMALRDEIVVATKAYFPWRSAPNAGGNSRKGLMQAIDDSLPDWAWIMSICSRSIGGMITPRSKRPWKRCMIS